jgi:hypothetical protein
MGSEGGVSGSNARERVVGNLSTTRGIVQSQRRVPIVKSDAAVLMATPENALPRMGGPEKQGTGKTTENVISLLANQNKMIQMQNKGE